MGNEQQEAARRDLSVLMREMRGWPPERAAQAVWEWMGAQGFEQAHTPTDDERELLDEADALVESWDRKGSWSPDSPVGLVMRFASLLRRPAPPELQTEPTDAQVLAWIDHTLGLPMYQGGALTDYDDAVLTTLRTVRKMLDGTTRPDASWRTVQDTPTDDERMVIYANSNVTRGKFAAAAVHAALTAVGAHHGGPVIVLGAKPSEIAQRATVIRDAGKTEVEPGTITAGTDFARRPVRAEPTDAVIVDMLTAFYGEERDGWSMGKVRRMHAALRAAAEQGESR